MGTHPGESTCLSNNRQETCDLGHRAGDNQVRSSVCFSYHPDRVESKFGNLDILPLI